MTQDKSREAFEAYMTADGENIDKDSNGEYISLLSHSQWCGFKEGYKAYRADILATLKSDRAVEVVKHAIIESENSPHKMLDHYAYDYSKAAIAALIKEFE